MSLALSSAQQNLSKVAAGKALDTDKVFEYVVENYSGAEFTIEDLQEDQDLLEIITPPKATKKSSRGAKTSEERTRESYDSERCDARVWLNGFGGQCTHKKDEESCMCKHHAEDGKWGTDLRDEDGNWWLGLVTGSRPENPVRPGGSGKSKAWKMTEDGEVVEKPKKEKKPKMTDEDKEQKKKEQEEKKEQKKKEREEKKDKKEQEKEQKKKEKEQKKEDKEQKKVVKDVDSILDEIVTQVESGDEEPIEEETEPVSPTPTLDLPEADSEYVEIVFERVEYQQHNETGEILDPDDFSVMGTWNADTESIDWEDEEAKKKHEEKKRGL